MAFLGSGFIWVGWAVSKGLSFPCAPAVPFPARAGPGPGNSGAPGWAPMPPPLLQGLLGPRSLPPGLWEVPYEGHRFGVAFVFVLFCFVGPFLHFLFFLFFSFPIFLIHLDVWFCGGAMKLQKLKERQRKRSVDPSVVARSTAPTRRVGSVDPRMVARSTASTPRVGSVDPSMVARSTASTRRVGSVDPSVVGRSTASTRA